LSSLPAILEASASPGAVRLRARVEPTSRLLEGHFPEEPVVPGVAHLQIVLEAVQRLEGRPMRLSELRGFRLRRKIILGEDFEVRVSRTGEKGGFAFELRTLAGVASAGALRAIHDG
jgi:3-hydroxymyristoyl/3-hydroxydecanoyl-(acyl carrier protein) dehydratase